MITCADKEGRGYANIYVYIIYISIYIYLYLSIYLYIYIDISIYLSIYIYVYIYIHILYCIYIYKHLVAEVPDAAALQHSVPADHAPVVCDAAARVAHGVRVLAHDQRTRGAVELVRLW